MSAMATVRGPWSRSRWWLMVATAMAVQLGLIFGLGERRPPSPRAVTSALGVRLSEARSEWLDLQDPILFALPRERSFSGRSWLEKARKEYPSFRWNEPPQDLAFPTAGIGELFRHYLRSNPLTASTLDTLPVPEVQLDGPPDTTEILPPASRLHITGALAGRQLLAPPDLPAWPSTDLLTNTIVRVIVDADGYVQSATVLGSERIAGGSGSADADRHALELSRKLRFAPISGDSWLANPLHQISSGNLIFEWRSVPMATNPTPRS